MRNPANIVQRVRHDQPSPLDEIATPPFSLCSWSLDIHEIHQVVVTNVPQITLCVRNYDKSRVKCGKLEVQLPHDLDRDLAVALYARAGIRTNCVRRRRQSPVRGSRRRRRESLA
jgi:hypothetical protein